MRQHDDIGDQQDKILPTTPQDSSGTEDDFPVDDEGTLEVPPPRGDSGGPLVSPFQVFEQILFRSIMGGCCAYILLNIISWVIYPPSISFFEAMRLTVAELLQWF